MKRSARITVHPEALQHNLRRAQELAPNSKRLAVIKANGYGHGSAATAGILYEQADAFAVSCVPEAIVLRDAGIDKQITILVFMRQKKSFTALEGSSSIRFNYVL